MNSKKLFFIAGLALLMTLFLTIVAFKLAEPNSNPNAAPNSLVAPVPSNTDAYDENKEEATHEELYLSKRGERLIHEKLVKPISKKFGLSLSVNQFSRCPSGVQYYQIASPTEDKPYFLMQLSLQDGCMPIDLCQFRVSIDQKNIEVWEEEHEVLIAPETYVAQLDEEKLMDYQMEIEPIEELPKKSPAQKTL